ncbi:uncharacterized protein Z518_06635 [Rhinocladiella mackenziei CBS 650.93]|uniref:Uncharacterized protein n=1 Tax=Rhinocladiella mackenziei CBS 650.93 TaxID=1442369 RepID=A0A0D2J2G3_9EURO|nr:uncharacterized protein Z518_06635 [Rhinocladiella mackenziei CBS 650.93]KIX03085.1 hypothetical protein Z518_06635 [Rhinocladiella mackenziei CBS 650.93]
MQSFLHLHARYPRISRQPPVPFHPQQTRFAHQSYGNEQSGMQQGTDEKNPKAHFEHPGPEAPARKGTASSSSRSQSNNSSDNTSQGARPVIHRPKSAAEIDDPEVRKHNEEMEQRSERTTNQLGEEDNKVDKKFWQGDVGPKKGN